MSNGELKPPLPLWKQLAKIIGVVLAAVVPVLLAAYEFQVIMSHVILPAFSNKEHAVASSILIGVVAALAVVAVLPIIRRVRKGARREGEEEVRRLWEAQLSDVKPIVDTVERLRKSFEILYGGERKAPLYDSLRKDSAKLMDQWYDLVVNEKQKEEVRLAASALDSYLSQLARLEQPGTKYTLLLANYEIYAFCVQAILKQLIRFRPESGGTIYVSTTLTMSLSRWYNLSTEVNEQKKLRAFTSKRWEQYRSLAARLKTDRDDPTHWIQGRRILLGSDQSGVGRGLYVRVGSQGKPHRVSEAKRVVLPECMELLDEVDNTVRNGPQDDLVYLIAKHKDAEENCRGDHPEFTKLREDHFEPKYHNGVHSKYSVIDPEQKGMFCAYVNWPYPVRKYEDVFAVDLSGVGEGSFGIGFHRDRDGQRSGIVFLGDAEIQIHLSQLNRCWEAAGNS